MQGESGQMEIVLRALLVAFQWVGGEILHSLRRHSECVSSTRFLLGSSLTLFSGSCHACIMPQATMPSYWISDIVRGGRINNVTSRNPHSVRRLTLRLSPPASHLQSSLPIRDARLTTVAEKKSSIALALGIGGLVAFVIFLAMASHPNYLALFGWTAWVFAYFSVLAQNFSEKAPIPTRGGTVRYEDRPHLYKLIYGSLFFLGAFVLLVLVLVNLSHR
jgi:hypothetical protein